MIVAKYFILFIKLVASGFNEFLDKNGPYMSAAISFYAFFSLFPLMLALVTVFSVFLNFRGIEDRIIEGLQTQIPVLAEQDDEFISGFFRTLQDGREITSTLAVVGLLWASTAVFSTIRKSINSIWGIKKTRPFLQERAIDFSLMIGASVLLIGSVFVTGALGFLQELSTIWFPDSPTSGDELWTKVAAFIPPVLSFFVFLMLYWWLPNTKLRFREVWPTALLGAIAFEISKQVFILYLQGVGGVTSTFYGGVSTIIVLLVFIYVSAIIMLVGAMMTSRWVFYLANQEQRKNNDALSRNLRRIRATRALPGMAGLAPAGASGDEITGPAPIERRSF